MSQPTGTPTGTPNPTIDVNVKSGDTSTDSTKVDDTTTNAPKPGEEDTKGLKSALQKERKAREDLEKQIRDGELAKLPELERAKAVAEELTKENAQLKTENQRMKIGMELGLKWSVAKRIAGDTEAEMRSDAAELLKSLRNEDDEKKQTTKDRDTVNKAKTNDGPKSGPAGKPDMNSLLRAAAGRTIR